MYKLTISDTVKFNVKLSVNDAGSTRDFTLKLIGTRLAQDAIADVFATEPDLSTADFLRRHITGWDDQHLVVDESGAPAPFGPEAFDAVLNLIGAVSVIFAAYLQALGQSHGAGARAKN